MAEKKITLSIGGTDFEFKVATLDYNNYVNEIKPDSKVAPSKNFVRRCLVDKKQADALNELCDQGLSVDIAGHLIEEFRPKLEIEVKK